MPQLTSTKPNNFSAKGRPGALSYQTSSIRAAFIRQRPHGRNCPELTTEETSRQLAKPRGAVLKRGAGTCQPSGDRSPYSRYIDSWSFSARFAFKSATPAGAPSDRFTASSLAPSSDVEPTIERAEEQTPSAEAAEETTAQGPVGFMGAPGQSTPMPMEKVVESCGDVSLHEVGTTFFTDGTSGWTQQCADQMAAAAAQQQAVAPAPAEGDAGTGSYVHPGSFCDGGTGVSKKGVPMVCAPGSDGRNRWQSA